MDNIQLKKYKVNSQRQWHVSGGLPGGKVSRSREKCFACLYFLLRIHNGKQRPAGKWPPRQSSVPQCNSVHNISVGYFYQFDTFWTTRSWSVWPRLSTIYRASRRFKFRLVVDTEMQMWCCSFDRVACFHVDSKRMWPLKPKVWHLALKSYCSVVVLRLFENLIRITIMWQQLNVCVGPIFYSKKEIRKRQGNVFNVLWNFKYTYFYQYFCQQEWFIRASMLKDFILISDTAYLQILSIIVTETFSVSMQNVFF